MDNININQSDLTNSPGSSGPGYHKPLYAKILSLSDFKALLDLDNTSLAAGAPLMGLIA